MLEVRGIDYESIGFAWAVRDSINSIERDANERILAWTRQARIYEAMHAGRDAQLGVGLDALMEVAPDHPALALTGLQWLDGSPVYGFETAYCDAYDRVAAAHGLPLSIRPMTPADLAAAQVLAAPVHETSFIIFWTRWHWRGNEYRSRQGAERARRRAAELAREAA